MKAIIFVVLFVAGTLAAQNNESKDVEVMEAGVNRRLPVPNRQRREQKINFPDEEDLDTPLSQRPPRYTKDGYAINYNLACISRSCFCERTCIPWAPCDCMCPPPCPPTTTTTEKPEDVCVNGAPNWTYPECCFNGGHGEFCCKNGAENIHCCLNGANNPWCGFPTQPPVVVPPTTPPTTPRENDCDQCRCQPCIPWVPCPPCPCQSRCGGFGK